VNCGRLAMPASALSTRPRPPQAAPTAKPASGAGSGRHPRAPHSL
jgi:hypothetical protein